MLCTIKRWCSLLFRPWFPRSGSCIGTIGASIALSGALFDTVLVPSIHAEERIRVATFNCSMNRNELGQLLRDLGSSSDEQIRKVASIIRIVRPDVILLNEFDEVADEAAVNLFRTNYLQQELEDAGSSGTPIIFPYAFVPAVNTGVPSGRDLDRDSRTDGPGDGFGFGRFAGQYGMVVLSKFPLKVEEVRSFRHLLWKDLPNPLLPEEIVDGQVKGWYSDEDLNVFRLSSKSHSDVPILVGNSPFHLLISHPTPPAFDGAEDRNGRRNHDEIRLWKNYLSSGSSEWLKDDRGRSGGLAASEHFVIVGDLNADPIDGGSVPGAIQQILTHPRVNSTFVPESQGAVEASVRQARANLQHKGSAAHDTSDFNDQSVGNLRVDYVLPSNGLRVVGGGVYWPKQGEAGADLVDCSDHRLVWLDLVIP
ncbi:MAG: endonuclease/exonuclease/phosphatase family protein [Planctomyces sp.]|nr:endonuclease/exonuclease/phosphatase family protein [Planctomyces sp.]